ncbi:ABC-type sugar transport system, ATPase component [Chitinophaga sp. CF118]|uniref:ABC transporter ATP-binding protein n=1 Tax=Chitinophaga sp. CF118 TaxID=1884367 RepID=UPI0008E6BF84|nr:ABC transporter ATP-binding protein [Chitinophaga sp. CF118]SFE00559.1 ABC-type sugar transport system, ATPase component [Chitinophaga sp. CF118]
MSLLQVSGICKQQQGAFVLKETSFTQQQFEKIAIAGETGSGKSTLMKIIGGLTQADGGEVLFENIRVKGPEEVLLPGHPGIAYLSQHFELRNHYRVEELLSYSNKLSDEDAENIYKVCRITHLMKRKNDQLSGGEKQRIALAKLLITSPKLLLLDEPFSNLDAIHKGILKSIIYDLGEKLEITCMLISHDAQDILSWADKVLVMKDGQVIQQGTPQDVYSKPVNEYVAALFGKYNLLSLNGKDTFIRPENIKIVPKENGTLKGKVDKVLFFGSHYELDVRLPDNTVTIRTGENGIKKGDTVYISPAKDKAWYFTS